MVSQERTAELLKYLPKTIDDWSPQQRVWFQRSIKSEKSVAECAEELKAAEEPEVEDDTVVLSEKDPLYLQQLALAGRALPVSESEGGRLTLYEAQQHILAGGDVKSDSFTDNRIVHDVRMSKPHNWSYGKILPPKNSDEVTFAKIGQYALAGYELKNKGEEGNREDVRNYL